MFVRRVPRGPNDGRTAEAAAAGPKLYSLRLVGSAPSTIEMSKPRTGPARPIIVETDERKVARVYSALAMLIMSL